VPEFYTRDETGIPTAWIARMRESMARLTPRFSADRAVREYTEQHYLPAAAAYRARAAATGALGRQMVTWRHTVDQRWAALRFGTVTVETDGTDHAFEVQVFVQDLDPEAVRVELYANGLNDDGPVRRQMTRLRRVEGADGGHVYGARVPATRPATDYTARIIPHHEGVAVPLEIARILWQR
jgi:starch phosphorylase